MMLKALGVVLALSLVWMPRAGAAAFRTSGSALAAAQEQEPQDQEPPEQEPPESPGQEPQEPQDQGPPEEQPQEEPAPYEAFTAEQLDNLLARIALYPDPLLAQVLVAATFPDQIDDASRWVRSYGQQGVDDQPWDVSVRAVAHYPAVLNMMDDDLDWTTAVGQAYVYQSTDVMMSIQRLRAMAQQQGNLVTTPEQEVVYEDGYYNIWPARPDYIYVPVYDPAIIFFRPIYSRGFFMGFSFGPALVIGVWLNRDCDWRRHRIYYTGWQGRGWIARSRPHIHLNPHYVDPRYSRIVVNRRVVQRPVNFNGMARYESVHGNVHFQNRAHAVRRPAPQPARVTNKVIERNLPPNQRLDPFRGYRQPAAAPTPRAVPPARPIPPTRQATMPAPARPAEQPRAYPQNQRPAPAPVERPAAPPRAAPQARPAAPAYSPPPAPRPSSVFGRGDGAFNDRAAGERGRQSRTQMSQPQRSTPRAQPAPRSEPRSAPAQRSAPAPHSAPSHQRPGRK